MQNTVTHHIAALLTFSLVVASVILSAALFLLWLTITFVPLFVITYLCWPFAYAYSKTSRVLDEKILRFKREILVHEREF